MSPKTFKPGKAVFIGDPTTLTPRQYFAGIAFLSLHSSDVLYQGVCAEADEANRNILDVLVERSFDIAERFMSKLPEAPCATPSSPESPT